MTPLATFYKQQEKTILEVVNDVTGIFKEGGETEQRASVLKSGGRPIGQATVSISHHFAPFEPRI